jgi:hypothetical protein
VVPAIREAHSWRILIFYVYMIIVIMHVGQEVLCGWRCFEFMTFLQNLCYENWLECTYVRCAEYWNFLIALFDMGTLYPVARSLGEQCFMMEPLQKWKQEKAKHWCLH